MSKRPVVRVVPLYGDLCRVCVGMFNPFVPRRDVVGEV